MIKTLHLLTGNENAWINGCVLYDDLITIIMQLVGKNALFNIHISSEPLKNYIKATKVGNIGNAVLYKTKHFTFHVCDKKATEYKLGKQFYFKINKPNYETTH